MLTIRNEQMALLGARMRGESIDRLCQWLRLHFEAETACYQDGELQEAVGAALTRANSWGIRSFRGSLRYLNLTAIYGWNFDAEPCNEWMRDYLSDPQVSDPEQRIHRLVDECIYRQRLEKSNRRLAAEFGLSEEGFPLLAPREAAAAAGDGQFGDESASGRARSSAPTLDVAYVPTPEAVVRAMLRLADVGAGDTVYDLGCGDGRIVVLAAREHHARGVGIDLNPVRIHEAVENAQRNGVAELVRFEENDLFEADIGEATVVTLYLLRHLNLRLRPKLLRELKPGARVVSRSFDMSHWTPDKEEQADGTWVYLWKVPAR